MITIIPGLALSGGYGSDGKSLWRDRIGKRKGNKSKLSKAWITAGTVHF
jgi:hypothetical protein